MIDSTQLKDDWGYNVGATTYGTPNKKLVDKKPGTTTSSSGTSGTTGTTSGGNTMPNSTFNYPSEWDQAGDVWSQMAGGNYTNTGMDWLKNLMSSGGSPVDVSGWGAAQKATMMDDYSDMVKQMAEQAGVGGTRYSSGLQGQIANYGGKLQNQFQSNLMDRWLQSQEAGMGRAYGAGGLLSQLGLGAQQGGAEGLLSLGGQRAQLPLSVASLMGGLGGQLTGQQVDPWTQMMASLLGGTGQATPQTYTPSGFQQALSGLSGTLGNVDWSNIFGSSRRNPAAMPTAAVQNISGQDYGDTLGWLKGLGAL